MATVKDATELKTCVALGDLREAVEILAKNKANHKSIPILHHVLIDVFNAGVTLCTNDLDFDLACRLPARGTGFEWRATVHKNDLAAVLAVWPDAPVTLERVADNELRLSAGSYAVRLPMEPVENFPTLSAGSVKGIGQIDSVDLLSAIQKTRFAITSEETRYFLDGAQFTFEEGRVRAVATDGHRLSVVTVPATTEQPATFVLQRKGMHLLAAIAATVPVVRVRQAEKYLVFDAGAWVLKARTIDVNFPAYDRVIPKANPHRLTLDRAATIAALRRVAVKANERSRGIRWRFHGDRLCLSAPTIESLETGGASDVVPIDYGGPDQTLILNAAYMTDMLDAIDTERVIVDFKDELTQIALRPFAPIGYEMTGVVMPMRA